MWAGPVENWVKACDLILEMDVTTIVPEGNEVIVVAAPTGPEAAKHSQAIQSNAKQRKAQQINAKANTAKQRNTL